LAYEALAAVVLHLSCFRDVFYGIDKELVVGTISGLYTINQSEFIMKSKET
jgi:hypothetical protein